MLLTIIKDNHKIILNLKGLGFSIGDDKLEQIYLFHFSLIFVNFTFNLLNAIFSSKVTWRNLRSLQELYNR